MDYAVKDDTTVVKYRVEDCLPRRPASSQKRSLSFDPLRKLRYDCHAVRNYGWYLTSGILQEDICTGCPSALLLTW